MQSGPEPAPPAYDGPAVTAICALTVTSGPFAARHILAQLIERLTRRGLDPEEINSVQLVIAEVLNNITEHAYLPEDAPGPIRISCFGKDDGLHFSVTDTGRPMPDGKLPLGHLQSVEVDPPDLPEGGFGWFLIQDLAKDVSYVREGRQNHLSLRIAVGPTIAIK